LDAISFVRDGGVYISPFLRGAGLFTRPGKNQAEDPLATLSPREMEVFSNLVNGMRAKDIADLLEISPKTVDTYRASLMRKLNVHDLVGLVKFAIERNLTSTSSQR
jgi:DNA-binding NarL/FixJ family response regulator